MFVVRLMDADSTRSSKRREVVAEEGVAVRQEVCLCDNTHSRHRHSSSMKWRSRDWARALSQERLWRYGSFGTIRFRCERRTRMQLHWVRGCWAGGGGRAGRGAVRREVRGSGMFGRDPMRCCWRLQERQEGKGVMKRVNGRVMSSRWASEANAGAA